MSRYYQNAVDMLAATRAMRKERLAGVGRTMKTWVYEPVRDGVKYLGFGGTAGALVGLAWGGVGAVPVLGAIIGKNAKAIGKSAKGGLEMFGNAAAYESINPEAIYRPRERQVAQEQQRDERVAQTQGQTGASGRQNYFGWVNDRNGTLTDRVENQESTTQENEQTTVDVPGQMYFDGFAENTKIESTRQTDEKTSISRKNTRSGRMKMPDEVEAGRLNPYGIRLIRFSDGDGNLEYAGPIDTKVKIDNQEKEFMYDALREGWNESEIDAYLATEKDKIALSGQGRGMRHPRDHTGKKFTLDRKGYVYFPGASRYEDNETGDALNPDHVPERKRKKALSEDHRKVKRLERKLDEALSLGPIETAGNGQRVYFDRTKEYDGNAPTIDATPEEVAGIQNTNAQENSNRTMEVLRKVGYGVGEFGKGIGHTGEWLAKKRANATAYANLVKVAEQRKVTPELAYATDQRLRAMEEVGLARILAEGATPRDFELEAMRQGLAARRNSLIEEASAFFNVDPDRTLSPQELQQYLQAVQQYIAQTRQRAHQIAAFQELIDQAA